ncbi:MAG: amidinotransferase [Alphaproteobacteria bacterium]|nr:amidinotransferase [Alphaproteobacteria bacterium]
MDTSLKLLPQLVPDLASPVSTYNEWDPLEEVIVGRLEGATIPTPHISYTYNQSRLTRLLYRPFAGRPYPSFMVRRAQAELDEFIHTLEAEGITVRRPDTIPHRKRFKTPNWTSSGFNITCPRDGFLVIGDEIIETPMAWRCRYFELSAYRRLFKEYFAKGARWTAAPKPELLDELYDHKFTVPEGAEPLRYVINEFEPVFDAADFTRCGRDIFCIRSSVTNASGIEWLRRHLDGAYRIHEIKSRCRTPMHIDSSFVPLAPGKVLVNPEFIDVDRLPPVLKSWDILIPPEPAPIPPSVHSMCSKWIAINVLMLDEKRVVVEKGQHALIKSLTDWGFTPIPCPFIHYSPFGGAFHCATLDVRRRGALQSYF